MLEEKLAEVDVLAIGAHPDDLELGCAGSLARLRTQGRSLGAIDLTRGELGSRGTPQRRAEEAAEAARILGLAFRHNLELADGDLNPADRTARRLLIEAIRICRPRLIVTHSPTGHPDHWAAHTLVTEAAHHAGLAKIESGRDRFRPERIAFWIQYTQRVLPEVAVDVTPYYQIKEQALRAYASQLTDPGSGEPETYLSRPEFLAQIESHHRHLGNLAGCPLAEGFLLARLPRIDDLAAW